MIYFCDKTLDGNKAQNIAERSLIEAFKQYTTVDVVQIKFVYKIKLIQKLFVLLTILHTVIFQKRKELIYSRNIIICYLCLVLRRRFILEQHFIPNESTKPLVRFCLKKLLMHRNANVVVISRQLQALLSSHYVVEARLAVLHSGANTNKYNQPYKRASIRNIGYAGSFLKGRGIDYILGAASENDDLVFHLFGDPDTFLEEYRGKEYPKNIVFHGFMPQNMLHKNLALQDLLLAPYAVEVSVHGSNISTANYMSPLKIFEYMGSRVPILSSNNPSIAEILTDGFDGFLYEAGDYNSFKSKLSEILNKSSSELETVANNAFTKFRNEFTWTARAERIINDFAI